MTMFIDENTECGIKKKLLYAGDGELPDFPDGTKVKFHYKTVKLDDARTVLDDSKKYGKPMELIIGKQFKLEVWEKCIKTMRLNEVAQYTVDKSLIGVYPVVAKSLREFASGGKIEHEKKHCCGLAQFQNSGLGHSDLDELLQNPQPLDFIFEVTEIDYPGEYKKESWAMNEQEKMDSVPSLQAEGNQLYKQKKYCKAAEKYAEALGCLEQLALKEKPGDTEWRRLDAMKIPLLLNYAQCKLLLKDYYQVIEHTNTVLDKDSDNVKALFRRAKAHFACWNFEDAKKDFTRAAELDKTLSGVVKKELKILEETKKEKDLEEKTRLQGLFEKM
ncbi:AH receptor-interacting protein-like [Saccoglossus kowalevskii]|uniref:AH receptor-interacting protein-like n=1 Tax=Saccoglossus kowalevskii TaxID=10224 RepID=A0ABM0LYD1_SACKO|nr:PREDICTED: AH receptor-interacting protein-like [Saccoglossus kowalevskii]